MGNPAYDARRAAERSAAEKDRAANESAQAAFEALTAFMTGHASLSITTNMLGGGSGWNIRLVRDAVKQPVQLDPEPLTDERLTEIAAKLRPGTKSE